MNNFTRYSVLPLFFLLLVLGACAQLQPVLKQSSTALEEQANSRMAVQEYAPAAQFYQLASKTAQEPRRSKLLLSGADAAMQAKNTALAQQLLGDVSPQSLDSHGQAQLQLLTLQTRIAGKPPAQALELLPPPDASTPPDLAAKTWALRAQLFFDNNQVVGGVHALVQRDVWLVNPEQSKANDYKIWNQLRQHPPAPDAKAATGDKITQGWLELAAIGANVSPDRKALERRLRTWETHYPGHPATRHILPERFDYTATLSSGNSIGLALPLTGKFASAGAAIKDGFMAGYYAQTHTSGDASALPNLRIYDTNALDGVNQLIQRITADGVSVLVGPLQKYLATELAQHQDLNIPILALNYVDSNTVPPNFYEFGLAPEDEARAAAKRALAKGWRTALALIPDGDWGNRVLDAFRDAFVQGGGSLIDYAQFNPRKLDHATPIKRVLRYGQKTSRPEDAGGGTSIRRQDADLIFIAAQPEQARQIRTQLRFFHASRLPVLATSTVFSGTVDASKDGDLNGLLFADMPWIIGTEPDIRARRKDTKALWPKMDHRNPRLFAMGYDAWLLLQHIRADALQPGLLLHGNTGDLVLGTDGKIHRELDWAQFKRGKPVPLPKLVPAQQQQPDNY